MPRLATVSAHTDRTHVYSFVLDWLKEQWGIWWAEVSGVCEPRGTRQTLSGEKPAFRCRPAAKGESSGHVLCLGGPIPLWRSGRERCRGGDRYYLDVEAQASPRRWPQGQVYVGSAVRLGYLRITVAKQGAMLIDVFVERKEAEDLFRKLAVELRRVDPQPEPDAQRPPSAAKPESPPAPELDYPLAELLAEIPEKLRRGLFRPAEVELVLRQITGLRPHQVTWLMFSVGPLAIAGLYVPGAQHAPAYEALARLGRPGELACDLMVALSPRAKQSERHVAASRLAHTTLSRGKLFHPDRWDGKLRDVFAARAREAGLTQREAWEDLVLPSLLSSADTLAHDTLPSDDPVADIRRRLRKVVETELLGQSADSKAPDVESLDARPTDAESEGSVLDVLPGPEPDPLEALVEKEDAEQRQRQAALVKRSANPTELRLLELLEEGWTQAEAARLLGMDPSTARQHLLRLRKRLRQV